MTLNTEALDAYREHAFPRRAQAVMPHGNTRTTLFVPPTPPYAVRGDGVWVVDQLGHRTIDCNNNYTSLIHGHAQPDVMRAAAEQATLGTAFGLPTVSEVDLAEHLATRTAMPQWRFSNSGSEAVMTAVRAARAFTGRDLLLRFEGSYHGTYDAVVSASAPGVPAAVAETSISVPQGDRDAFDAAMEEHGHRVAAVLIDLMPNRAGLVPADGEFVRHLRAESRRYGALLVIDEVITFRLDEGGFHQTYGVDPDLITVGKVVGGGFPVGAVGGTTEVMQIFDPTSGASVGWGGTFSANPMSMVSGLEALRRFTGDDVKRLNTLGDGLRSSLVSEGVAVTGFGSLLRLREDLDAGELWWGLYLGGVLAGSNGLLALSTPMTPSDTARITEVVAATVHRMREPSHDPRGAG